MAGLTGKLVAGAIVLSAAAFGAVMWYMQVYYYYDEVSAETADIRATSVVTGSPEPLLAQNVEAIDADSSPIRFRACFTTPQSQAMMTETYQVIDTAVPLVAPGWFDCFDADAIGEALEAEEAIGFMGQENIEYGIDRVLAIYPDGRGFAWNQINACGKAAFDGKPLPVNCPTPPE